MFVLFINSMMVQEETAESYWFEAERYPWASCLVCLASRLQARPREDSGALCPQCGAPAALTGLRTGRALSKC